MPKASAMRGTAVLMEMPSRCFEISAGPTRISRTLSITVRGVNVSTLADSQHSLRRSPRRFASTVPPAWMPGVRTLASKACSVAGATGRAVSKSTLGVWRFNTCANSGSATPPGIRRRCATGRWSQSFNCVGNSPCGHNATSAFTPCSASPITSSSRKAPWPISTCRPNGSVSGSRRSRSQYSVMPPSSRRSTSQAWRLCGLGAVMA